HYISIFINGRYIKNFLLNKAILEGYHTLLMVVRYPICYINIEMDPILVDVNVHPTKLEVRLSKEDQLFELIVTKIREAFKDRILIPQNDMDKMTKKNKVLDQFEQQKMDFEKRQQQNNLEQNVEQSSEPNVNNANNASADNSTSYINQPDNERSGIQESQNDYDDYKKIQNDLLYDLETTSSDSTDNEVSTADNILKDNGEEDIKGRVSASPTRRIPYMEIVGQVHGTYIIAQNENGMFMIDQHAAQERIKYVYFREKIGDVVNESQNLLIPLTFHFSKDELMIINQYKDELDKVGVHLEPFGGHDYIVDSYPVWFPKEEAEEIIKDMIEYVLEHKKVDVRKIREEA